MSNGFRIREHISSEGLETTVDASELSEDLERVLGEDSGFEITVKHLPRARLTRLYETHSRAKKHRGAATGERKLKKAEFFKAFIDEAIKGWSGLTVGILKKLVQVQADGVPDDTPVEFDTDQASALLRQTYYLETALSEYVTEPVNFIGPTEGERDEEAVAGE